MKTLVIALAAVAFAGAASAQCMGAKTAQTPIVTAPAVGS